MKFLKPFTSANLKYLDVVTAAFVAVLIVSNISSSAKIIDWGFSVFGIRLAFDAGTLLFPISYIFGDILTEVYGYARARRVIWIGFGALALTSAYLALVGLMPGEADWQGYAGDQAFGAILGGVASGGIVLASLSAYLVGEFSNSFVLAKMKIVQKGKKLWMRTIGSTLVGQGLDSFIFVIIACSLGVFPWSIALSLIIANYVFKVFIEVALTPLTYRVVNFLKKEEGVDTYDRNTKFSPFNI